MVLSSIHTLDIPQKKGRRQRTEELLGTASSERLYDPLPPREVWEAQSRGIQPGELPENFGHIPGVDGRFSRSALVLPPHIQALQEEAHGKTLHIISFQNSVEQHESIAHTPGVEIHHIPIRGASPFKEIEFVHTLVSYIMSLDGHVHFHCLRGQTRTGLATAATMRRFGQSIFSILKQYKRHASNFGNLSTMIALSKLGLTKPEELDELPDGLVS